jgi:hypothetical protein
VGGFPLWGGVGGRARQRVQGRALAFLAKRISPAASYISSLMPARISHQLTG